MMVEAYIALALLTLGAICMCVNWADSRYQEARREQRRQQRNG